MKIAFISDIHMDTNHHHDFVSAFTNICNSMDLDYLIFAGDTASNAYFALGFYHSLQSLVATKILQIPGNHERYYYHKKNTPKSVVNSQSSKIFYELLNNQKFGLFNNPIITKDWVIIGHTGWYDYSFNTKYPNINIEKVYKKRNILMNWDDNKYIDGDKGNIYSDINTTNEILCLKNTTILIKKYV
jgi:predicted phosphodiesterase